MRVHNIVRPASGEGPVSRVSWGTVVRTAWRSRTPQMCVVREQNTEASASSVASVVVCCAPVLRGAWPKVTCKPSSVRGRSTVYVPPKRSFLPLSHHVATICLALTLPSGSSDQPGDGPGAQCPSIRSCSRWGLPGLRCRHRSGELLPRRFTLTPSVRGGMFLWHFPSGHPAPPLAGILPGGARTFLPPHSPQ